MPCSVPQTASNVRFHRLRLSDFNIKRQKQPTRQYLFVNRYRGFARVQQMKSGNLSIEIKTNAARFGFVD